MCYAYHVAVTILINYICPVMFKEVHYLFQDTYNLSTCLLLSLAYTIKAALPQKLPRDTVFLNNN